MIGTPSADFIRASGHMRCLAKAGHMASEILSNSISPDAEADHDFHLMKKSFGNTVVVKDLDLEVGQDSCWLVNLTGYGLSRKICDQVA